MKALEKILAAARAAQGKKRRLTGPIAEPRNDLERELVRIWREVLLLDAIGIEDGFFELGGTSIDLANVGGRIRAELGADVPLASLLANPTIASAAAIVDRARSTGADTAKVVPVRPRPTTVPASPEQVYYYGLYAPNHNRFLEMNLFEGKLDVNALERAFAEVIRRHEALRTTIEERDGRLFQIVHEEVPASLVRVDAADEGALLRLATEEMERIIDPAKAPLVAGTLAHMGEGRHALMLAVPHIVVDDRSLAIVFKELVRLYNAFVAGEPSPLPEPPLQYADYALWHARAEGDAKNLEFWRGMLARTPALELPTDRPRPPRARGRQRARAASLSPGVVDTLRALGAREGATLFMTLLACVGVFFSREASQDAFLIRSPLANRERPETEGIVGSFSHPLPFRADLAGDPSFREVVRRMRQEVIAAHAHRPLPFDAFRRESEIWDDFDRKCTRAGFNLLLGNRSETFAEMAGLRVTSLAHVWRAAVRLYLDIYFFAIEKNEALEIMVYFNEEIFDAERIGSAIDGFRPLVERLVAAPDASISGATGA